MSITNDYLKDNSKEISLRIMAEMGNNGMKNKELADKLECAENTVWRKNQNYDGSYYNKDDLIKIAKIFNCSIYKLVYDEFVLNKNVYEQNKEELKRNYKVTLNYLNSIGIHLEPGVFWCGSVYAFKRVIEELKPFLSTNSLKYYKEHKKQIDNCTLKGNLILSLKENPNDNLSNTEELKLKYIDINYFDYISAFPIDENKEKTSATHERFLQVNDNKSINYNDIVKNGCLQLRFYLTDDNYQKDNLKTISVEDLNKLFNYIDTMTRNSIHALLDNNLTSYISRE